MTQQLTVPAALIDLKLLRETLDKNLPTYPADLREAIEIAETLAAALQRVGDLETSRISAGDHLVGYKGIPGGFDTYAFYVGVSFALARVQQIIRDPA